jgi:hypothetical protein
MIQPTLRSALPVDMYSNRLSAALLYLSILLALDSLSLSLSGVSLLQSTICCDLLGLSVHYNRLLLCAVYFSSTLSTSIPTTTDYPIHSAAPRQERRHHRFGASETVVLERLSAQLCLGDTTAPTVCYAMLCSSAPPSLISFTHSSYTCMILARWMPLV